MQAGAEPKVAVWSDKQQKLAMLDYNQDMAIRLFADDSDIFTLAPCQVGLVRFGLLLWLLSAGMMCSSQSECKECPEMLLGSEPSVLQNMLHMYLHMCPSVKLQGCTAQSTAATRKLQRGLGHV